MMCKNWRKIEENHHYEVESHEDQSDADGYQADRSGINKSSYDGNPLYAADALRHQQGAL